jgi:hypothetical protein
MNALPFTTVNGLLTCIWDDRYEFFPDRESAERWALRQGFVAVFEEPEPFEPLYMYGVTGEEQA